MFVNPTELNTLSITALMLIPLIGVLIIALQGKSENTKAPHFIAAATTFTVFVLSLVMAFAYWPHAGGENQYLFRDTWNWIPFLNTSYDVAVDGLSMPMVVLTTFLLFICALASWNIGDKRPKLYFALFLFLETALIGVFTSVDMLLFFIFWELELIPMYFLIGIWGGARREYASTKFILYTVLASAGMFISLLAIYFFVGAYSFDYVTVSQSGILRELSMFVQVLLFAGFFLCFAVKLPVVPLHTWLPDAHVEAPTPISMILAGVLLKMGGYAIMRITYPIFPDAGEKFWLIVSALGVIAIIYGALCAMAQTDWKRLVAYSSVSHMGFVTLGIGVMTRSGWDGAYYQMIGHGISSAMMFYLVGVVYDRAHHRDINRLGGLWIQYPRLGGWSLLGFLAGMGLPGLCGFIGELLVVMGTFQAGSQFNPITTAILGSVACLGVILTAGYILWMFQRVYMGKPRAEYEHFPPMQTREYAIIVTLGIAALVFGVLPMLVFMVTHGTFDGVMRTLAIGVGG